MLKRWLLAAIPAICLCLLPVGLEAKGGGHSGGHSKSGSYRSKGSSEKSEKKATDGTTVGAHDRSASDRCASCPRDKNGRILRDPKQRATFEKSTGYPHGRKGYVVDHIVPLECGGADVPSNMQWQTNAEARVKDAGEVRCRR